MTPSDIILLTLKTAFCAFATWAGAGLGSWLATYKSRRGRTDYTIEDLNIERKRQRKKRLVTGCFYCFHCNTPLKPRDMKPVISYLLLRGKCRYCHNPIDPLHIRYELLGATSALIIALIIILL